MSDTPTAASATTFENPIVDSHEVPELNRKVTIYVSGSVTVDSALEKSTIKLSQDDIREAIGVGTCPLHKNCYNLNSY